MEGFLGFLIFAAAVAAGGYFIYRKVKSRKEGTGSTTPPSNPPKWKNK